MILHLGMDSEKMISHTDHNASHTHTWVTGAAGVMAVFVGNKYPFVKVIVLLITPCSVAPSMTQATRVEVEVVAASLKKGPTRYAFPSFGG